MTSILYLHLTAHGEPDYEAEPDAEHQPIVTGVHALTSAGDELRAKVSPADDWSLPKRMKSELRKSGVRSVGPLVVVSDLINVCDLLVVYNFQQTDLLMKRWRSMIGRTPVWLRKIEVIDLARRATHLCKLPMDDGLNMDGVYRVPTLREASEALDGWDADDAYALKVLHQTMMEREAA